MNQSAQNPITARHGRKVRARRLCCATLRTGQAPFTYAPDGCSVLAEVNQSQGGCAAKGASAATREKPVSRGTPSCAQGSTLGFSVSPRDPRFSPVSLRCLLPRSLLVGATTVSNTTETVYLPAASGPIPVLASSTANPSPSTQTTSTPPEDSPTPKAAPAGSSWQ
jgi:hypothetical protein